MSDKKISPEEHARMLYEGMNVLMERKRAAHPEFHTKEFTEALTKILKDNHPKGKTNKKK